MNKYPRIGVAIVMIRDHKLLVGQRHNAHGPETWAPPGGNIEWGECAEEAAIREAKEETGLTVSNPRILTVTSSVFAKEDKHYITVYLITKEVEGEPTILEPDKFNNLMWVGLDNMPKPMFLTWEDVINNPHTAQQLATELA